MNPTELERYLHDHIPLSRAMGVAVVAVTLDEVLLRAPLAPNINHRETVFGGSASAICILAAWSLVHVRLREAAVPTRLVIQRNTMEYLLPVADGFSARATVHDARAWPQFFRTLARRKRARIQIASTLEHGSIVAGRMSAEFVALGDASLHAPA